MFQLKAAITAQSTVVMVTTSVSTNPLPIVEATAPPTNAPVKLKNAAIAIAWRGVSTSRRDDGRDRVCRVVEAIAVFENDSGQNDQNEREHAVCLLRIFQRHL